MHNAISNRLERIHRGDDPHVLGRMTSGWAIFANAQPTAVRGCCMLIPDPVVPALNDLSREQRAAFLTDLALLGDAVLAATGSERINYLILCNQVPELHGHVVPRFASEAPEQRRLGPFEAYDFAAAPQADARGRDADLFARLAAALKATQRH
jgi:diadenosine tetraphosphate (Ap4A) HIT family hydrolase